MKKIALYTVLTGGYDVLKPIPPSLAKGIDCFVVTDDENLSVEGWATVPIPVTDNPCRQQRALKLDFGSVECLQGYDTIVYIDANMSLIRPLSELLRHFKGGILTVQHPKRSCVYQEGWAIIDLNKADREGVLAQLGNYASSGIRPGSGMYQTGFMVRDRSEKTIEFCREWAQELERFTHRDQLSIIPARDRTAMKVDTIQIAVFNRGIRIHKHLVKKKPKIHYLVPYSTEKNIGKAYNEAIEQLNADDDDWIVVRDGDTLYPTPTWGKQIEEALMRHGHDYQLIGAVTNRIGSMHQRVEGMFGNWDIQDHVHKAIEVEQENFGKIEEIKEGVAGFFMAFQVKTWKQIKFIDTTDPNQSRLFDTKFSQAVRSKGGRIGLMTGLYILHLYRPLSDNPRSDVKHLL